MEDKELLAKAITKGLAYQENGGKLDLNKTSAGQSGEMKSIFQFTPATWSRYSKEVFGKDEVLNNDNEAYVVYNKVKKWLDEGNTTSQIASMWNAGEGNPDAYKEEWRGTNSHGVSYDTPTYAKNVLNYAKKFYQEELSKQSPTQSSSTQPIAPQAPIGQNSDTGGLLNKSVSESRLKV